MNIVVYGDYTNSAAVSGYLEANLIRKIGGGTAVVSGNNSGVQRLQIDEGLVQVNVTENMGGAVAFAGGNLEVTSGTVIVPSVAMDANGTLTADAGTAVTLTTLSGDSVLSIAGAGEVTAGDMSLNSTPVFITGTMITGTFGSNMTKGATTVANGGLLQLMDAIPTSVPGITEIQLGGKLQVLAGVSVPANDASNGDVFNDGETGGSLQFDAGSTLKLGNGSIWARDITVDAAL